MEDETVRSITPKERSFVIQFSPDSKAVQTNEMPDRQRIMIPSIQNLQVPSMPSLTNLRDSAKRFDTTDLETQPDPSKQPLVVKILGLHILELALCFAFTLVLQFVPAYRNFVTKFPWVAAISGSTALTLYIAMLSFPWMSVRRPQNVLLYVLFSLLLAFTISFLGAVVNDVLILNYVTGAFCLLTAFLSTYTGICEQVTFAGGSWAALTSSIMVLGYSLILMGSDYYGLVLWTGLAITVYGIYLVYALKRIWFSERKDWPEDAYVPAALGLHLDWLLMLWGAGKVITIEYNNSRLASRLTLTRSSPEM